MSDGERVVRCTIEMDLIEGEHFNPSHLPLSNSLATKYAVDAFVDMLHQAIEGENGWTLDQDSWVQAKLLE